MLKHYTLYLRLSALYNVLYHKLAHPPFLNEFVAFLSKVCMPTHLCHSTYCYVKQEALKKHAVLCKRRDQQMKAVTIYCYCKSADCV